MKKTNRRKFLLTAALAGAASAINAKPFIEDKQIVHHVFFWLKNPNSTEDRDKLVEDVKILSKVESVKEMHVGIVANTEKRNIVDASWAVSALMFFNTLEDQAAYQNHPVHLDFIKNYSALLSRVVVYDMQEV